MVDVLGIIVCAHSVYKLLSKRIQKEQNSGENSPENFQKSISEVSFSALKSCFSDLFDLI